MPLDPKLATDLLDKLKAMEAPLQEVVDSNGGYGEDMPPSSRMAPMEGLVRPGDEEEDDMEPVGDMPSENAEMAEETGGEMGADLANVDAKTHNARAKAEADALKAGKKNRVSRGFMDAVDKAVG